MPESFCEARLGLQHQREMFGAGPSRIGHVDVRVGAVGNECIRMFHHFRRHIGMQIEARHQRQIPADHFAHARQNLAFAVVEMLGYHRAMQIEIDRIERAGGRNAIDHYLDDALKRILGDMGGGGGATGDGRHHLPAIGFGGFDKARQPDIDLAHDLEHVGAFGHRWPAAAMHEIVKGRLRRRKGVGLVQETANGDAGHQSSLGRSFHARELAPSLRKAQAREAIASRMALAPFWDCSLPSLRGAARPPWLEERGRQRRGMDCFAEPVIGRAFRAIEPFRRHMVVMSASPTALPSAGRARRGCRPRYAR